MTLSLRVLNLTRKFNEDAPESGSSALSRSHSFALSRRDVRAVFNEDKYLHSISLLIKPLTLDESIAALTVSRVRLCAPACACVRARDHGRSELSIYIVVSRL